MFSEDLLPNIEKKVDERWSLLTEQLSSSAIEGLKYLTLVHLGGMGGTLSFMGATKTATYFLGAAFFCFFFGATCVGLTYLLRVVHLKRLVKGWIADCDALYQQANPMTWGQVHINDRKRTNIFDWALTSAVISLALFLCGGSFGFFAVLRYSQ
jgi:hypothetical protein